MISAGCVSTDQKRLAAAANDIGRISTRVNLPERPAECRSRMVRVYPRLGIDKPRNTQLRWELSADAKDRQDERCDAFYEDLKRKLAADPSPAK